MKIWIISDSHFGHKNIIKYCNRPENFAEIILINLLKYVREDDVLLHLGDVCFKDFDGFHNQYIKPLQCKKWLVKGNHDNASNSFYLKYWDFVGDSISLAHHKKNILFTHIPREKHEYDINIHGHLHNSGHRGNIIDGCFLIAMEYINYRPITLERCVYLINKGEKYARF